MAENLYEWRREWRPWSSTVPEVEVFPRSPDVPEEGERGVLVLSFGTYNDECDAWDLKAAKTCLCLEQFETKEKSGERKMLTKKRRYGCKSLQIDAEPKKHNALDSSEVTETSSSSRKMPTFGEGVKEIECSSESSSPVSVFDIAIDAEGDCLTSPDSTLARCVTREEEKSSRKTVSSTAEMFIKEHAPLKSRDRVLLCRSHKDRSKKSRKVQAAVDRDVSDIWAYNCGLEEDNVNRANWVARNLAKVEEAEEIRRVIGLEILEFLLQETVDEMSYFLF
ncbi:hypothetical protein HPP92_013441 [Vanilla planifolia]|uniref:DUF4378 domain-containing protein n=1 Tax=Vanilla planifolia TaxID=51239 RepID=A0A835R3J0_VANPL|nr:hypothetical protein HPP92_013441 [Vanilla planifolia]